MNNVMITATTATWTTDAGDSIRVTFTAAPRKVRKSETGPAYRVRGVSEFIAGPAFDKYGPHPVAVDMVMSAADALAWHMSWSP
jgi:hypothetical protein